ncbi:MAG: hypothetical protein COU32_00480 [Candidatus Magasanikbacteria bacterium CG10_big_fil_rev_8_21_14_0_10_42_10]|uniref:Tryptophan synthase beta chain-like PALP domain-containing protein n=1 Tax=Candidatus Magasanikbacteria bacterium CG10_big_fil_rev_8_21_14_0_10_42_10 TaxID=1974649 RepID=A0A2H0TX15_9BACT|nr:MAG: hypothetical protein COU32_00480 [Candidatus Magasanikbacteria bacterium CG10_big_fil_rev_8_21_14_0_10_42_10]
MNDRITDIQRFGNLAYPPMKTPQQAYPALAKALGINNVFLKREDEHPYGSHKGRSIPHMMKTYIKRDGIRDFVISSSGNAALAAIRMAMKHNQNNPDKQITLRVFVGKNIDEKKLSRLHNEITNTTSGINIEQVERPKQETFKLDKEKIATSLRQSTDDLALEGYQELAYELMKIPDLIAVFIPTSSGTTAQAIAEVFVREQPTTQVHIVQTTACHPIATALGATGEDTDSSVAGAIVDNIAHRKQAVADAVTLTHGAGWIVNDEKIESAQKLVNETTHIEISPNSALAVAGLKKALESKIKFEGAVACVITGM